MPIVTCLRCGGTGKHWVAKPPKHGKNTTYVLGCRCQKCTAAHATYEFNRLRRKEQ